MAIYAFTIEEHVFGVAQPNALTELNGVFCVVGRISIGSNP